jgi:two-component system LytT family sensor kinase
MGMSESHVRIARWSTTRQVLLAFGVWTFLAAFSASQTVVYLAQTGRPVLWREMLTGRFADWYTCALFTPLFFWLGRRYPIDRRSWTRTLPLTVAITSVCVVIKYSLLVPVEHALGLNLQASITRELSRNFATESMAFWAVIGIIHALEFNRRFRERELAAADLRTRLSEAQFEALRAQIHPHFLFNTLHSISTLMHRDIEAADRMLMRLSDLLRLTLKHRGENEIPLRDELVLADHYLEIMRVRFGDRLEVTKTIDQSVLDAMVPQFVLQPLIENALNHGVATTVGKGIVTIEGIARNGDLELSVTDSGRGALGSPTMNGRGIGLSNTRLRLEQLYGDAQSITLEKTVSGETRVSVKIPRHRASQAGAA